MQSDFIDEKYKAKLNELVERSESHNAQVNSKLASVRALQMKVIDALESRSRAEKQALHEASELLSQEKFEDALSSLAKIKFSLHSEKE